MASQISQYAGFGSLWTSSSQYIIDFERGLVTHSKTLTKGQFNRYMSDSSRAIQRPDLNPRQAFQYFTTYILGQKYLQYIRQQHQNQLYKLYFQSSVSYVQNHRQQFQKVQNQLAYPVTQIRYGGYVRSAVERDNLVNYINKIKEKVVHYGMKKWQVYEKQAAAQRTYNTLKNIAFKPRQTKAAVEENSEQ